MHYNVKRNSPKYVGFYDMLVKKEKCGRGRRLERGRRALRFLPAKKCHLLTKDVCVVGSRFDLGRQCGGVTSVVWSRFDLGRLCCRSVVWSRFDLGRLCGGSVVWSRFDLGRL
ncbi:unnamed protein product, partial [Candidula unifasciata]